MFSDLASLVEVLSEGMIPQFFLQTVQLSFVLLLLPALNNNW